MKTEWRLSPEQYQIAFGHVVQAKGAAQDPGIYVKPDLTKYASYSEKVLAVLRANPGAAISPGDLNQMTGGKGSRWIATALNHHFRKGVVLRRGGGYVWNVGFTPAPPGLRKPNPNSNAAKARAYLREANGEPRTGAQIAQAVGMFINSVWGTMHADIKRGNIVKVGTQFAWNVKAET